MSTGHFRFLHEPHTEQEVVCLFFTLLNHLEFEQPVIVEKVRSAFPDCTIRAGGRQIRIEFELYGRSFLEHHPYDGCDMLVCWRDDHNVWPSGIRVLELAPRVMKAHSELFQSIDPTYPARWNEDTFFAAAHRQGTSADDLAIMRRLMELARERRFGPVWFKSPKPQFAVGRPHSFFKVKAEGRIGFPFRYLRAGESFVELADRLNGAVPALNLIGTDQSAKNRGRALSVFQSDAQLLAFFDVWSWFQAARNGVSVRDGDLS